ncbi:hypothetical protein [Leuconostoc rapi]|uniref:hypothetical protein n=1 Tax=Leuconostoc rapi TaxID=1406906 RepID=UPI00195E96B2|nr:hypothetical protein [Leuconostoc rapi]MBM7436329.1 hypothetical protein [Leuconostoc rapi]
METYYEIKRIYRSKVAYFLIALLALLITLPFFELPASETDVITSQYSLQLNSQKSTYNSLKNGHSNAEKEAVKKAKVNYDLIQKISENATDGQIKSAEKNIYQFEKNNLNEMENKSIVGGNIFGQQMMVEQYGKNIKNTGKINLPARDLTATAYISYLLTNLLPNSMIYIAFALITFNLFLPTSGLLGKRLILNRKFSKVSYLISKYLASVGVFVGIIAVILSAVFIVIGIKNGFGSFNVVSAFTVDFDKVVMLNFGDVIFKFFGITILNLSVMFSIGLLFQQFANNNLIQVVLEMMPFLFVGQKEILGFLQSFLPTASFDLRKTAFGYSWMDALGSSQNITIDNSKIIVISLLWIIVIVLIHLFLKSRTSKKLI